MAEGRPHLRLVCTKVGRANLSGRRPPAPRTKELTASPNRPAHALELTERTIAEVADALARRNARTGPSVPDPIPLALQIDPGADIEFLRTAFDFEVVADNGGTVLAAITDHTLKKFAQSIEKYRKESYGGGSAARIHEVKAGSERLKALLDDELFAHWPTIKDGDRLVVDVAISCTGQAVGKAFPSRDERWSDDEWDERLTGVENSWLEAYKAWDDLKDERTSALLELVKFHDGRVLGGPVEDDLSSVHKLPDSVQMRIEISGAGLRDIVLNYAYLFEVSLPDGFEQHLSEPAAGVANFDAIKAPLPDAPLVCVMDSGIQDGHRLLAPAVRPEFGMCFLPGAKETDVADYCAHGGHGTRVAGAAAWGTAPGQGHPACWLVNARILNASNSIPEHVYPPLLAKRVVERYAQRGVRLFVHSVNAASCKRRPHMPAWAAEFDRLAAELDVLIIQSAGNIPIHSTTGDNPGVQEHLRAGREYPAYLAEPSARVSNPGVAMHSVTVGSLARATVNSGAWKTIAPGDHVAAFSRCGPGMWNAPKPDIVEYAGDYGVTASDSGPLVGIPGSLREAYPVLVRSTMQHPGPAVDADAVGTSFAAPKAAHIVAKIAASLPNERAITYRALLVHSARWPERVAADSRSGGQPNAEAVRMQALRTLGFGIPHEERATSCTRMRTTMFTSGDNRIRAREAHVYQITLPDTLRSISAGCRVLLEVTLAYAAPPRRTRRGRGYLSTWLDWQTSKRNESLTSFLDRVLKESHGGRDGGKLFEWMLGDHNSGTIDAARRNLGSVQKDWAEVEGDELPDAFGLAVVGHPGWDGRTEAAVPYSLCVTIELLRGDLGDLDLYNEIEVGLAALRVNVPVRSGHEP